MSVKRMDLSRPGDTPRQHEVEIILLDDDDLKYLVTVPHLGDDPVYVGRRARANVSMRHPSIPIDRIVVGAIRELPSEDPETGAVRVHLADPPTWIRRTVVINDDRSPRLGNAQRIEFYDSHPEWQVVAHPTPPSDFQPGFYDWIFAWPAPHLEPDEISTEPPMYVAEAIEAASWGRNVSAVVRAPEDAEA